MSTSKKSDLEKALESNNEIRISVKGRKSGRDISTLVWFVHEKDKLLLLPVSGSDSNWYKNILKTPTMTVSAGKSKITAKTRPVTEQDRVKEIVEKFRAKYGAADIKSYYSKLDAAVELPLSH